MKSVMRVSGFLVAVLYACGAQAYTFTVKNFTNNGHKVQVKLKGISEELSDIEEVQSYEPGVLMQLKNKLTGWVNEAKNALMPALTQLQNSVAQSSTVNLAMNLGKFKDEIENQFRTSALKVTAQEWVTELEELKQDVTRNAKNFTATKRAELDSKLKELKVTMAAELEKANKRAVLNPNTVAFEYPGILCLSKIFVDDTVKPRPIYGVPGKLYDTWQKTVNDDYTKYPALINANKDSLEDMSKSFFGICFSRQFDIVDLGGGELVLITRNKI